MTKHITALAVSSLVAAAASAQVLLNETFDYNVALGGSLVGTAANDYANTSGGVGGWARNTTTGIFNMGANLGGTGGAGFLDAQIASRAILASAGTAGEVMTFSFIIEVDAVAAAANGQRIMFESAGSSSNFGYGINFDIGATGNVVSYNRIGTGTNTVSPVTFAVDTPTLVSGVFTRTGAYAGGLTISYFQGAGFSSLVGSQTSTGGSWAAPTFTATAPLSVVLRLNGTAGAYTVDNLSLTSSVVPEPSTYAAILGAVVLGFVAIRRRKA